MKKGNEHEDEEKVAPKCKCFQYKKKNIHTTIRNALKRIGIIMIMKHYDKSLPASIQSKGMARTAAKNCFSKYEPIKRLMPSFYYF